MESLELSSSALIVDGVTSLELVKIFNNLTISSATFLALTSLQTLTVSGNPILTTLSFPVLKSHWGSNSNEVSISYSPALTTVNLTNLVSSTSSVSIFQNSTLVTLLLDKLVFVKNWFNTESNPALTTLNFPALITVGVSSALGFSAATCTNLANVSFPKYVPVNGRDLLFTDCALTQVSVDHVLARAVSSVGYVSGRVNLSGGTNAVPGPQGQLDKATLIARGVTVLTN